MDSLGFFSGKLKNSKKLLKIMIICFWAIEVLFLSINIHKQIYIYIYRERERERETDRQTDRQADRQADRERERQRQRQREYSTRNKLFL